jgi:hypothetical protein
MTSKLGQWLQCVRRALGSRYVRLLEDDVARERAEIERQREEISRLRLENRALLNSLLGTAGVPPVEEPRSAPPPIAPIRRRSWPQIAAARESASARVPASPGRRGIPLKEPRRDSSLRSE